MTFPFRLIPFFAPERSTKIGFLITRKTNPCCFASRWYSKHKHEEDTREPPGTRFDLFQTRRSHNCRVLRFDGKYHLPSFNRNDVIQISLGCDRHLRRLPASHGHFRYCALIVHCENQLNGLINRTCGTDEDAWALETRLQGLAMASRVHVRMVLCMVWGSWSPSYAQSSLVFPSIPLFALSNRN